MGAALTYARRYALFALVGIAGEDDLDAPDLLTEPSPAVTTDTSQGAPNGRKSPNGSIHKPRQPKPLLAIEPSAALRGELVAEIQELKDPDELALWAHRRLPAKNTLTADDARAVEVAYQELLIQSDAQPQDVAALDQPTSRLDLPAARRPAASATRPISPLWQRKPAWSASARLAMPIISNLPSRDRSDARSVTNLPCRCVVNITGICTAMATKWRGGPMCRLRRSR